MIVFGKAKALGFAQPNIQCANVGEAIAAQGGKRRAQRGRSIDQHQAFGVGMPMHTSLALPTPRPMLTAMCWGLGKSVFARAPSRINRVRYWRPLSGLFLFLRRVSPDREGGIISALPSFNNLIAVGPGDPVGNPLLQPRTKINNLTAVLAGSLI